METVPVYVGLDYHSKSVQVCVVDGAGRVLANRRCGNSVLEIAGMTSGWGVPAGVAIESCCGAADLSEQLAKELAWPVTMAHPGYVNRMKTSPDKSDFSDARMLAELSRAGFVPRVWLAGKEVRELRVLVRFRADQVDRRRCVKTRVLALLRHERVDEPALGRWTRGWLAWLRGCEQLSEAARWIIASHLEELTQLKGRIRGVETLLAQKTSDDPLVQRMLGLPGVGPVTAWTMRAMVGRFDRFKSGKQLARFCALTPRNASSGQRVADAGLIKAGDPLLKTVLIQAAHRLRRYDRRWAELSDRMRGRGKPAGVVNAAVANRWVRWMHHQLKEVPMAA